jgi:Protease inhibitor Inh
MKFSALALLPCALALASCASSERLGMFGSSGGDDQPRQMTSRPVSAPEPLMAAPTESVSSEPLPPVGAPGSEAGSSLGPADMSGGGAPAPRTQVATAPINPPVVSTGGGGIAGSWKISDAARGNCSISLTRQALLDLYRASPSGCQAGSLAKVNAWQSRGQEIDLLEPGGRTAVRLFPTGDGSYEGAATQSGAKIRMTR